MSAPKEQTTKTPHVVIIGGGFGGLYAAKHLVNQPVRVTLIDRQNHHTFQPLLYQVATGSLAPGDIASPLRWVFRKAHNVRVLMETVHRIDPAQQCVFLGKQVIYYDELIVAAGSRTHYFGNDGWEKSTAHLKSIENATDMRRQILESIEMATQQEEPELQQAYTTFVVVGGGPTGVELAGALSELIYKTMALELKELPQQVFNILLIEASERLLGAYPQALSHTTQARLQQMHVTVMTKTLVTAIDAHRVVVHPKDKEPYPIASRTVLWTAGVAASPLATQLAEATDTQTDRQGRVVVNTNFTVGDKKNIYALGDMCHYQPVSQDSSGINASAPLPGVASVAMQEGKFVARHILAKINQQPLPHFQYRDKGLLAVIGKNVAVAHIAGINLSGFMAWMVWAWVHIWYLIEFDNKVLVFIQWAWTYFTDNRSSRLITHSQLCSESAETNTGVDFCGKSDEKKASD